MIANLEKTQSNTQQNMEQTQIPYNWSNTQQQHDHAFERTAA